MKKCRSSKHVDFKYVKGKADDGFGMVIHSYYEIYLLLNGKAEFVNKSIRKKIMPFQVVIVPPGEFHQFVVTGDIENYEYCVLDIYPEFFETDQPFKQLIEKTYMELPVSHRIIHNFLYLSECITSMDEINFSYLLQAITIDIVFLINNVTDTESSIRGNLSSLSLSLMNYINEHYTEQIDLNILSCKFHRSVSSLCHIFRNDFGISIKKYIILKRMHASYLALKNGKNPEQVSIDCGFSNYSTFYRAYKQHFGISPSETVKDV